MTSAVSISNMKTWINEILALFGACVPEEVDTGASQPATCRQDVFTGLFKLFQLPDFTEFGILVEAQS